MITEQKERLGKTVEELYDQLDEEEKRDSNKPLLIGEHVKMLSEVFNTLDLYKVLKE